jgi:hypothetical protein
MTVRATDLTCWDCRVAPVLPPLRCEDGHFVRIDPRAVEQQRLTLGSLDDEADLLVDVTRSPVRTGLRVKSTVP